MRSRTICHLASLPRVWWIMHNTHMVSYCTCMSIQILMKSNIKSASLFQNGFLSALPYLAMWLFSMFISHVADWMISSHRFSHTVTRKVINSIGEPSLHCVKQWIKQFNNCDLSLLIPILVLGCVNKTLVLFTFILKTCLL